MVEFKVANIPYLLLTEPHNTWVFISLTVLFALTFFQTVDSYIGLVYMGMVLASYVIYKELPSNKKFGTFSTKNNTLKSVAVAVVVYAIFIFLAGAIVFSTQASAFNSQSIFGRISGSLLGSASKVVIDGPVFAGFPLITAFIYSVYIPIIETTFAVMVMLGIASALNIDLKLAFNFAVSNTIAIFLAVASLMTFFHFKVKGVTNNPDLIITFAFFFLTCALALWMKEIESANYLHILNNFVSVRTVLGL